MKMIKEKIVALLILALPACATANPELLSSNIIGIETSSYSSNVRIIKTSAVQSASDIRVIGKVKRVSTNDKRYVPLGHIDAVLTDSKGAVLFETTAEYSPRVIPRKSIGRTSQFSLEIPVVAPDGSVLRLSFHPYLHS